MASSHGSELKKVKKAKLEREGLVYSRVDSPFWNRGQRVVLAAGRFHYLGVRFRRAVQAFLRSHYASEALFTWLLLYVCGRVSMIPFI
jgi:hypothetical protein